MGREKGQALVEYALFQAAFIPVMVTIGYLAVFTAFLYIPARADMATTAVDALALREPVTVTNNTIAEYTITCTPNGNIVECTAVIPTFIGGLTVDANRTFEGEMR